ncbi:FAD/NAD(P)-binding protein [Burkholderia sp. RS01]|uniref:FAD/NAD(P)-binding protein n=1 Tax=unclassified Burkholderia TaxID=2613784 RepID=UPI003218A4D9
MPAQHPSVVFIGGGPRTAGILERLAANRPELAAGPLDVHVVEPYEPGSGRIWRFDQDPGLMLNSAAADVTMFTDTSVLCEGPAVDGPGLAGWAAGVLDGSITDVPPLPPHLLEQLRSLSGTTFPTRQLQSKYLEWFYRRAVRALGSGVTVTVHRDTAVAVEPLTAEPDGAGYGVRLAGGGTLHADVVVTALGHTDSQPDARSKRWVDFAARHGGFHAAPSYTTDIDYSAVAPGQDVIVSGMGLAFVDLLVLLMEGRGGRFEEAPDGGLRYVPSGAEPRLWAGSRRGVPYHSKISSALRGEPAGNPRFFTAEAVDALLARHGELDFRTQLWPLIAKDAGYGYYRELLTGSPASTGQSGRAAMGWAEFSRRFAALDWYSASRRELVAEAVPDTALHLDLERLDRPFDGRQFAGHREVQDAVAAYVEHDLELRTGPDHPETLALFIALLKVYMDLGRIVPPERLNARSQQDVHGWWHGFFSFVDSGPPPRRLREMLAVHRAGLLQFLGPGLSVAADEEAGQFVATSPQSGLTVRATAFIEARLPAPSAAESANPLLRSLHAAGLGTEQHLLTADGAHSTGRLLVSSAHQLVGRGGHPQNRLFGVGPGTSGWGAGAFARPGTNAAPFRENDALARRILTALAELTPSSTVTAAVGKA